MILPKELFGLRKPEEDEEWIISYNDQPYLISPEGYGKPFNVKHIRVKDFRSSMKLRMAWERLKEREKQRWLGTKKSERKPKGAKDGSDDIKRIL
jgi:hypothetical protein